MAYRRTDKVLRRLAARHEAIVGAARALAGEGGMAAVQVAPVASRAGIAAGTVYRYFRSKTEMIAAVVAAESEREISAVRAAADAAPGPLSALAAAIATFAARALARRRLAWAVLAEPVDAEIDPSRRAYRKRLADEISARLQTAAAAGQLPEQNVAVTAAAVVGVLIEGLIGPLAPDAEGSPPAARVTVQMLTLFALRGAGVADARARGLVIQTILPEAMDPRI
jgi:AcrR family transcriptional regulator